MSTPANLSRPTIRRGSYSCCAEACQKNRSSQKAQTPPHLISYVGPGEIYLEAEDLWLDQVERLAVNLDKTLSGLYTQSRQHSHSFTPTRTNAKIRGTVRRKRLSDLAVCDRGGRLLLAEALNALRCRGHGCDWRELEYSSGRSLRLSSRAVVLNFSRIVRLWASLTLPISR